MEKNFSASFFVNKNFTKCFRFRVFVFLIIYYLPPALQYLAILDNLSANISKLKHKKIQKIKYKMQKTLKQSFSVFGKTTLRKFSKLKIYVEGLSKIGADLVTNLILLNPFLITLHDTDMIQLEDCYSTYHYPKDTVGRKTRADYLIQMCHRLNNKVYVDKVNAEITEQTCLKYDILVFCDVYDLGRIISINKAIRQQKQKTVVLYASQFGYSGIMISDFGEEWDMFHSGQELPRIPIKAITNAEKGRVTTEYPHNYKTGDFVSINYVEGMKYVNGDARPVTVIDATNFQIEDTRNFGTYQKGGICQKINLLEKLKFVSFEQQLSKKHSQLMLIYKSIICFYQNNSKLPELFNQINEQQTMQNLKILAKKFDQKYNETNCRSIIKTSSYNFYPMIHLLAATLTLQCVKCTGKYRPIASPFLVDWYSKISFQAKKKIDGQFFNIIDTNTLEKLVKLQVGIVDDGSESLELLSLLYSCSIAEKTRIVLCGLESINETQQFDGLILKAQMKYQVVNQLFRNKKTQTMPCSLSFSNDLILSDMWKKIRILINTSSRLNQYVYNNVIWNQISVVDTTISELNGELTVSAPNKSQLQQIRVKDNNGSIREQLSDFKDCVNALVEIFRLIFIDVFEDMRCFFICKGSYIDRVKMSPMRKNIFLFLICCLEDGTYLDPENIVRICRFVYNEMFPHTKLDPKDQLIMDFLKSLYFLFAWFFTKKQLKIEEITNNFTLYLNKTTDEPNLSLKQKYDIAYTKLQMGNNQFTIPYLSLSDLYRKEHTIKFIWNGSQIMAKRLTIQQEITSKKFYKYYYRRIKPCPFMAQILNSLIPLTIIEVAYGKISNSQVDLISGKIVPKECPPPKKLKPQAGAVLIPVNSNQWTIIVIQGPKKIGQILERFNFMQNVKVLSIKYGSLILYDANDTKKKENQNKYVQALVDEKKDEYEFHIKAEDKQGRECEVCRVKYVSKA